MREAVIHMPSLQLLCFFTSIGFLFGCFMHKDSHPTNLHCLAGFTVRGPRVGPGQPPDRAALGHSHAGWLCHLLSRPRLLVPYSQ